MSTKDFIPFGKPNFSEAEISAVTGVLRSGWIGMGPETIAFEQELSAYLRVPHVVTVNSCTSALFLSALVSGVGPGDEVVCPSLTWCSTANIALYLGAKPVFCDVDPETMCVTPEHILEKITSKTKAVMVVHFAGLVADVKAVRESLPDNVCIIEDAAHALGASFGDGTPVGASGNLTCFSFYVNKNLSTGEGGAIALIDKNMAGRLASLRQHGLHADAWMRYINARSLPTGALCELGYKMNYTDLQASIGRVQLRRQEIFRAKRLSIAKRYVEGLNKVVPGVGFQSRILHPNHARHLFVILLPIEEMSMSRDEFLLALRSRNIGAGIHYAPLHDMPLYPTCNSAPLQNTDWLRRRIITLPISSSMTVQDAEYVIEQVRLLLRSGRISSWTGHPRSLAKANVKRA